MRSQSMANVTAFSTSEPFFDQKSPSSNNSASRQSHSLVTPQGTKLPGFGAVAKNIFGGVEDVAKQQYEKEMKTRQLKLLQETEEKRVKIVQLSQILKEYEENNAVLQKRWMEKKVKIQALEASADDFEHDNTEYEAM